MKYLVPGLFLFAFISCKTSGPSLFGKRSLHEQYGEKLEAAGLKNTLLGAAWFRWAETSLSNPININLPYKELGYFAADQPGALGLRFSARKGERLTITLERKPLQGFILYMELWRAPKANTTAKLLETPDTSQISFHYDVEEDESFILRLQPELLMKGEYTLTIQNGPSLSFPVQTSKQVISSFWGAERDGGARKHEGVDIFAAKGTPLVAAADGRITRVEETDGGGKVVWLRPEGKNYNLYYAHLDEQLVTSGQKVKAGEVIGKTGNTGNARTTGPHLHFGIYATGGAIDPLLFIQPSKAVPPPITADPGQVGNTIRISSPVKAFAMPDAGSGMVGILEKNTPLKVQSAYAGWYKAQTPEGNAVFIPASQAQHLSPIKKTRAGAGYYLLDGPYIDAARKIWVEKGEQVEILGAYKGFSYVQYKSTFGWIND